MERKVVLVTGAGRGIGASIARVFASNNYNVVINYNTSLDDALKLKSEIESSYNVECMSIKADVSDEEEVKKMTSLIINKFKRIDCLVNNAGIAIDNDLDCKSYEEFNKVISTNLVGTFYLTKLLKNKINDNGSIVFVSSTNGIDTPYIESIDYDASKSGIISLMHNFSKSLAPNIRVNTIAPGWVETPMNKLLSKEFREKEANKILLKRFAEPEEIANVIEFLISDKASYINNTVIRIDGGKND